MNNNIERNWNYNSKYPSIDDLIYNAKKKIPVLHLNIYRAVVMKMYIL